VNTGPFNFSNGATVVGATDSTARAVGTDSTGAGSTAKVEGTLGGYITDSHATAFDGTSAAITTSDTTEITGIHSAVIPEAVGGPSGGETVVVPVHVEMTPVAEVHVMPALPLP
jgi:hypothetical protein